MRRRFRIGLEAGSKLIKANSALAIAKLNVACTELNAGKVAIAVWRGKAVMAVLPFARQGQRVPEDGLRVSSPIQKVLADVAANLRSWHGSRGLLP